MQVAARRLIVVSAISLFGASTGVALGNFAAGGSRGTGADEIAAYMTMVDGAEGTAPAAQGDPADLAIRNGPSSYQCEGCDASRYNSMIDTIVADIAPLPRYQSQDAPLPAVRQDVAMPVRPAAVVDGVAAAGGQGGESIKPVQAPPLPD